MKQAIVIGAGPNGLAAAITLARQGWRVRVLEARDSLGGGCRTSDLTLPGFHHDVCSAIHPLALASPFFRSLDLAAHGLEWIEPPVLLAHPFDDGSAAVLYRDIAQTAATLGVDAEAYTRLMTPLIRDFETILPILLGPIRPTRHLLALARFGLPALTSLEWFVKHHFHGPQAPALLAGMASHSMIPLDRMGTTSFGLVLALTGHRWGWPLPRSGSQQLISALVAASAELPITFETGIDVTSLEAYGEADAVLFDTAPQNMVRIAKDELPDRYRKQIKRFRNGPGVFKIDFALSGPVAWTAAAANQAGTLHLGGTMADVAKSEEEAFLGKHPERPFTLVAQPSRFDPTRAPTGQHTLWAYCHVPSGSDVDMSERVIAQIERFAPGFRQLILKQATKTAKQMEQYNPNYIGGDINGGIQDLRQLFTRPTPNAWNPYRTPNPRLFLCSSATPPGGGVHGMCGYHAARSVLREHKD